MSELRELYQEYVLDHGRNPRNFRHPEGATHHAHGYNPLCGDKLALKIIEQAYVLAARPHKVIDIVIKQKMARFPGIILARHASGPPGKLVYLIEK